MSGAKWVNLHSLEHAANRDLRWMKTASRNRKHGRSTHFGKRNVFRLHLNESMESIVLRGFLLDRKGKVIPCRSTKNRKAALREPKVESLVRGIWRLRVSEAER